MKTRRERAEDINRALVQANKYYSRSVAIDNSDARGEIASRLAWALGDEDHSHVDVQLDSEASKTGGFISITVFTNRTVVSIKDWTFTEGNPEVRIVPRFALSQISITSADNLFGGGGPWGAAEDGLTVELMYRDLGWLKLGGGDATPQSLRALEELHPSLLEDLTRQS